MSSSGEEASGAFQLPSIYAFKPFFTLQPVQATRDKQLKQWRDLILQYFQHHGSFVMLPSTFVLFRNEELGRQLNTEGISAVVNFMISEGQAAWRDQQKSSLLIMWRRPEALAEEIYEWATQRALINSIITFYELHEGEEQKSTSFYNIDAFLLRRALSVLEASGKCCVVKGEGSGDEDGVKFL